MRLLRRVRRFAVQLRARARAGSIFGSPGMLSSRGAGAGIGGNVGKRFAREDLRAFSDRAWWNH